MNNTLNFPVIVMKEKATDKPLLVVSMVLTTMFVLFLGTFIPQLMPLWMSLSTRS